MPFEHEAVAALPSGSEAVKALLRSALVARFPYVLTEDDDPEDFDPLDGGTLVIDINYLGRVFHYDPDDTTTLHDGTTCLVTQGGYRYKLATGMDVLAWAVLSIETDAPDSSPGPALGDAYLVDTGATGEFAGHDDEVAIATARGWEFVTFGIGRLLYVRDEDAYYHRDDAGDWIAGFGTQTIADNSVPPSALLNYKVGGILKVENQTTNAPPSVAQGTAYIIGSSPTGAWSGNAGKIAIREASGSGSTFAIYTPVAGDVVYDKSTGAEYRFNGTAWISAAGSIVGFGRTRTSASVSTTLDSGTYYDYSSTAPTVNNYRHLDPATISFTAKSASNKLRIRYRCVPTLSNSADPTAINAPITAAIFRDAVSNAIAWAPISAKPADGVVYSGHYEFEFIVDAPDTSSHTYTIAFMNGGTSGTVTYQVNTVVDRDLTIEEIAL